jgi:hypothetical protein
MRCISSFPPMYKESFSKTYPSPPKQESIPFPNLTF